MIAARSEYPKGGMWRGPRGYLEPLVKPLRGVQENRSLPAPSCVPFQFCDPSRRLLLSFSPLGALEFHQVDAGERAPGRRSASRRSQQLSGPSPGSARLAAHLPPGWRCRWRRRGGRGALERTREATAARLAEARGRGEPTYLHTSVSLVVLAARFPGNKLRSLGSGVLFISLPAPLPSLELYKRS